jgi:hypothetical protein
MYKMRNFVLIRNEDISGVSGTGVVAEGIEFTNGTCALSWLTVNKSEAFYPNIKVLEHIHGHDGATDVVFVGEVKNG